VTVLNTTPGFNQVRGGARLDPINLGALLAGYQQGDHAAADGFAHQVQPLLFHHFLASTNDRQLALDLTQDCWIRLHQARSSFRPGEPVLPWLFSIARHTRIDYYRRSSARKRQGQMSTEEPSHDNRPALEANLTASKIVASLRLLPAGQREAFVLLKVHDLSVQEAARVTGSTPAALKQRAFRAYLHLRSLFAPDAVARPEEEQ
jgi:RNA polymerase sigma-70 factor, ECF subfamily